MSVQANNRLQRTGLRAAAEAQAFSLSIRTLWQHRFDILRQQETSS